MTRHRALVIAILALLVGFASEARATPFSFLPNGDLLVETAFKTRGVFGCYSYVPACTGSGTNSVVLGAGPASATFTFSGVNTVLQVGALGPTGVVLGEFHTFAPAGFTFDSLKLPTGTQGNILSFNLIVEQSSPVPFVGGPNWNFIGNGGLLAGDHFNLPLGLLPPGFHYRNIIFEVKTLPFSLPLSGDLELSGNIGLAPEPATLFLFGATAAGLGLTRWVRGRRTRHDQS